MSYSQEELQKELEWGYSNQRYIQSIIDNGLQAENKRNQLTQQLKSITNELSEVIYVGNHMTDLCKNIAVFAEEHAKAAEGILNNAIASAALCVPDANCNGISIRLDETKSTAAVTTPDGLDVSDIEGSGYGSVLSIMLRYACLKAQPGALPLLILDEQTSTLSGANIPFFYDLLQAMSKDISIVCIEQRGVGQNGFVSKAYKFVKLDDTTVVEENLNEANRGTENEVHP